MQTKSLLASYLRTRRAMRMSTEELARHRQKQWQRLQPALAKTPALASLAGRSLNDFPITNVQDIRSDYGRWNSLGQSHEDIMARAEHSTGSDTITAGYSTGTSGNRGVFLADAKERADYLGQILARLLPFRTMLAPNRLALHLRTNNSLYSDVRRRFFQFNYFDLRKRPEATFTNLKSYRPTILIAPPHRLLAFARLSDEQSPILPELKHLFFGSDGLSDAETKYLKSRFGHMPRSIYQTTEGFLGAMCQSGNLHLNDHSLNIELEPVANTNGYRPVITDLRRHSQPIVRIRGDDFLELANERCACGFAGRVIRSLQGRVQDIWRFGDQVISPPQVIDTVETVIGHSFNWKAYASPERITINVNHTCPDDVVRKLTEHVSSVLIPPVPIIVNKADIHWHGPKRKRVSWHD